MDTRGQGSDWSPGDTSDDHGDGNQFPGIMTRGIESPQSYYYRRVFTDAVRAVDVAASHGHVDPKRLAVTGSSQGGGIAIATAGLVGDRVKLLTADVPFLCHFRRAVTFVDTMPYYEISRHLRCHPGRREHVFNRLAYFDGIHFAPHVTARPLFSVALMDTVCPPSTIYAAYNCLASEKDIRTYAFNQHEGGGSLQLMERLQLAASVL